MDQLKRIADIMDGGDSYEGTVREKAYLRRIADKLEEGGGGSGGGTQADWAEDDSSKSAYIKNRPAIRAGDGDHSISEGAVELPEDAAIYTLYLTGDANATTYSYTTTDTLPSKANIQAYGVIKLEASTPTYTFIDTISLINHTITLGKTLSDSSVSNLEVKLYYRYRLVGTKSHAEGNSICAVFTYSHAEGGATMVLSGNAHAEGVQTRAQGGGSHVEGYYCHTLGYYSHAEGQRTIASHRSQHVFGEFNTVDNSTAAPNALGNYVEIVGNGSGTNSRSNARTLDWNGNETLAGKLTVGAGPTNDMDVATKQYVDQNAGGGSALIVTITAESVGGGAGTQYTANKTYKEISDAVLAGSVIYCLVQTGDSFAYNSLSGFGYESYTGKYYVEFGGGGGSYSYLECSAETDYPSWLST